MIVKVSRQSNALLDAVNGENGATFVAWSPDWGVFSMSAAVSDWNEDDYEVVDSSDDDQVAAIKELIESYKTDLAYQTDEEVTAFYETIGL
jgi:hypothetical protein